MLDAYQIKHRKFKSCMDNFLAGNIAACHARRRLFQQMLSTVRTAADWHRQHANTRTSEASHPVATPLPATVDEPTSQLSPSSTASTAPTNTDAPNGGGTNIDAGSAASDDVSYVGGGSINETPPQRSADRRSTTSTVAASVASGTSSTSGASGLPGTQTTNGSAASGITVQSPFAHKSSKKDAALMGGEACEDTKALPPPYEAAVATPSTGIVVYSSCCHS